MVNKLNESNMVMENRSIESRPKKILILNIISIIIFIPYIIIRLYYDGVVRYFYNLSRFITHWNFLFLFIYCIIRIFYKKNNTFLNIYFNMLLTLGFFVCIFYWILIFPFENFEIFFNTFNEFYYDVNIHIYPIFYVMLNYFFDKKIIFKYI